MENLENVIEAVLFVAGEAVPVSDLCFKFNVSEKEISAAVKNLQKKYDEKSGIKILEFNKKLQLASSPNYVDFVTLILNPIRQRNLTKATLETIAIIAYKQPVTRMEIEEIRGVGCDYAISILLEHNLIEIKGHKETVGKPALFGTTDEFLKRFNISSINDLPDYNDLMEQIQRIREDHTENLFGKYDTKLENVNGDVPGFVESDLDKKLEQLSKNTDSSSFAADDGFEMLDFDDDI